VLGGHLLSAKGPDPEAAVAAFDADPEAVGRELFISWMTATGNRTAREAAQRGDVETLAMLYNGSREWGVAMRRALNNLPESVREAAETIGESPALLSVPIIGASLLAAAGAFAWWSYSKRKRAR